MFITREKNFLKISDCNHFDIRATLESGQMFRYYKLGENDYNLISRDKICRIRQDNGNIIIEADDLDYFFDYFDLDTDYDKIWQHLFQFKELEEALLTGKGIRLLRQDLYETIISFIISANNNIPRIKGIIERICSHFGQNMGLYYAFPSVDELSIASIEDLRKLGCGFRDRYIFETIKTLKTSNFLNEVCGLETKNAEKKLKSLKGVGQKVADCIILFGLHRYDCYPVDTWIYKSGKNEELDTPEKVRKFYLSKYGDFAGYAQQYIFFSEREKKGK